MSKNPETEEILSSFTNPGFLKTRRLIDYVFPKEGMDTPSFTGQPWVRKLGYVAPVISLAILAALIAWPFYLLSRGISNVVNFLLVIMFVYTLRTLYFMCVALGLAIIAKFKKRKASIVLVLTLVPPIQATILIAVLSFFGNLLIPNSLLMSDYGKCRLVKTAYEKLYPNQKHVSETYWGFTPGKDSFDNVLDVLTKSKTDFTVTKFMDSSEFPTIHIESYKSFAQFGKGVTGILIFGKNQKLIEIVLNDKEKIHDTSDRYSSINPNSRLVKDVEKEPSKFNNLKDFFYTEYSPFMKKARLHLSQSEFITPDGLKIEVDHKTVTLTVIPAMEKLQEDKDHFKEALKVQNGKKSAGLIK